MEIFYKTNDTPFQYCTRNGTEAWIIAINPKTDKWSTTNTSFFSFYQRGYKGVLSSTTVVKIIHNVAVIHSLIKRLQTWEHLFIFPFTFFRRFQKATKVPSKIPQTWKAKFCCHSKRYQIYNLFLMNLSSSALPPSLLLSPSLQHFNISVLSFDFCPLLFLKSL